MRVKYIFIASVIIVTAVMMIKKNPSQLAASKAHIYYKYARFGLVEKIWITAKQDKSHSNSEIAKG